eukprot:362751-Chlamydomonas_euryale.AAC.1
MSMCSPASGTATPQLHTHAPLPHIFRRTKKPTIFRATSQWFASVEGFRAAALEQINVSGSFFCALGGEGLDGGLASGDAAANQCAWFLFWLCKMVGHGGVILNGVLQRPNHAHSCVNVCAGVHWRVWVRKCLCVLK